MLMFYFMSKTLCLIELILDQSPAINILYNNNNNIYILYMIFSQNDLV